MPDQFLSPEGDLENYFVSEYWLIDQYVGDELWIWGSPAGGALGNNTTTGNRSTPLTTFAGGTNWKQVSSGAGHVASVKIDGTLWVWGSGSGGRLGNGAITGNISTPVTTFAGGTNWKQVSSGNQYTVAVKTDGTLWTWGSMINGALGNGGSFGNISTPVTTFAGGTNWKQVSCSNFHTAAIKTDGTLWLWGRGIYGQLGNAETLDARSTPLTTFSGGTNWKQVSCGLFHTAAIKTDGTLWVWGRGIYGQLGNAETLDTRSTPLTTFSGGTNWKQVSSGRTHTAAIKTDGTLWVWGQNNTGQLGNAVTTNTSTPVTTFAGGTNWKQVSCSAANTFVAAVKTDGTLWVWGVGTSGQLGTNDSSNRSTPVTTFAGGTNWKQISSGGSQMAAIFSGTTPDLPLS